MIFLQPTWLILVPVIVAFALLSGKLIRRLVVPDWLLVHRAMQRMPGATRGRRTFHATSRLVPPILVVLALADPTWRGSPSVVVVLDRSAGGGAVTGDGSRIERALKAARSAHPSAEIRGFPEPGFGTPLDQSSGITTNVSDLIEFSAAMVASGRTVAIATWRDVEAPPPVGVYVVNDTIANAGIAAVRVMDDGSIWVRTAGTNGAPPRRIQVLGGAGETLSTREIPTPEAATVTIASSEARGVAGLKLDPPDADQSDDMVLLRGSSDPFRVAIVPGVPTDLLRALRSIPGAEVIDAEDRDSDLCVGFVGDRVSLLIEPTTWGPEWGRPVRRTVTSGIAGSGAFSSLHDAAAHVGQLWVSDALPTGTEVLVRAGGDPLLMRRRTTWILTADSTSGDWSTRAIFPRLIAAIASSARLATRLAVTRCGDYVVIPSASGKGALRDIDGGTRMVVGGPEGLSITSDVPGIVRVSHDGVTTELAFAVLSDAASSARAPRPRSSAPVESSQTEGHRMAGFLFWLAAASAVWLLCRGR